MVCEGRTGLEAPRLCGQDRVRIVALGAYFWQNLSSGWKVVWRTSRRQVAQNIAGWLEKLGMSEHAGRFAENAIDLSVLPGFD